MTHHIDAGLSDLTIYVTKFHYSVIHVTNTAGFRMNRVRVRALAYFAMSVEESAPGQLGGFHNRYAPYVFKDVGDVLLIENTTNFAVLDCDLYGLSHCITINNSSQGVLQRNTIHGGHGPGLVNVHHLITENNFQGSTWEGASWYFKYGYHIFHSSNTERHSWVSPVF